MNSITQQLAARKAQELVESRFMSLPGVHGVAIGFKVTGGVATDEVCVVVFVDKKLSRQQMPFDQLIPAVIPGTSIKTDVVEYPKIFALPESVSDIPDQKSAVGDDRNRYDPLKGGVQIQSHQNSGFVGTLGTFLYDTKHRRVVGLTNWHVLYPWSPPGGAGNSVFQPVEKSGNQIGSTINGIADGLVDGAVFEVSGRAYSMQIQDIGVWSGKLSQITLGANVLKRGRTTGLTRGTVRFINATIDVNYGNDHIIRFSNQIGVSPTAPYTKFLDSGDSGSVVVDNDGKRLVSLLFAGGQTDGWSNPIDDVEQHLDLRVNPDSSDTGIFNTMDVRAWFFPQLVNSKPVVFKSPYSLAPAVAIGLTELDMGNNANIRIAASSADVSTTGFTVSLNAWADSVLYSAECTWLKIVAGDPDFQVGTFSTIEDHPWDKPQHNTSRRINFKRPYANPPEVIVWLNELDVDNNANCRVNAYVTNVDSEGFTVHIDSWYDTVLYSGGVTWISVPTGKPGVVSGMYSTMNVRPWDQPRADTSGQITFPAGRFSSPPLIFSALCELDVDRKSNLRVVSSVTDVSTAGFTWHLDSWHDTVLYSAGCGYIALGS